MSKIFSKSLFSFSQRTVGQRPSSSNPMRQPLLSRVESDDEESSCKILDSSENAKMLKELILKTCQIESFGELKSLKYLDLSHNQFKLLSDDLKNLTYKV